MRVRGGGVGSARGVRRATALCLTTVAATLLAGCGTQPDDRIVGKQWQVTEIYDDPALPRGLPDGTPPTMIAFGRESYTGDGACGTFQGTLTWRDDGIVTIGAPAQVRDQPCDANARTFDDRLRAQLAGDIAIDAADPNLRATTIGDHPVGEAAPGWAAVAAG